MIADLPAPAPVARMRLADPAAFWADADARSEPVVFEGLVERWPAVAAGRSGSGALGAYLSALDTGAPINVFRGDQANRGRFFYAPDLRGLNFVSAKAPLAQVLAALIRDAGDPRAPTLYAGSVPTAETVQGFATANPAPWAPPGAQARIWIGNETRIAPHYDLSTNIACVVAGERRFTLFPPGEARNLYVGPVERTPAGQPVSMVDPDAPDLDRFPRYADAAAAALVADLAPGDALYIPPLWWHGVHASGALNVLVNYWSEADRSKSPFAALVHALYAIRELPAAERAAWRDWFDLYAFSGGDEATGHLPPYALGVLGPPSPDRDHLIRAYLTQTLGRGSGDGQR